MKQYKDTYIRSHKWRRLNKTTKIKVSDNDEWNTIVNQLVAIQWVWKEQKNELNEILMDK